MGIDFSEINYQGIHDSKNPGAYYAYEQFISNEKSGETQGYISHLERNGEIYLHDLMMISNATLITNQHSDLRISTNVSIQSIYTDHINSFVEEHAKHANNLILEITETGRIHDYLQYKESVEKLKDKGVSIAFDDFLSHDGVHELDHIVQIHPDIVKIDGTYFKQHIDNTNPLEEVIEILNELNISTIIEGVETQEHLDVALGLGVSLIQGFLFSRPSKTIDIKPCLPKTA